VRVYEAYRTFGPAGAAARRLTVRPASVSRTPTDTSARSARSGYSTLRLARAINVPRQRISRIQNGHVRPDLDEIMRILDVLKVGEVATGIGLRNVVHAGQF